METQVGGMPLTEELACEIAQDVSGIVGFPILITGRDGVVLGSGEPGRVGTVHEASLQVLRTLEPAEHTAAQARALSGVKPGISLPLVLDGEAVGTVGLTGPPARIRQFGLVVRRQTEILLRESARSRSRMLRERAVEDLLRDLALYDAAATDRAAVLTRAADLGLQPDLDRHALVLGLAPAAGSGRRTRPGDVTRVLREAFPSGQDLVGEVSTGRWTVLHHSPDVRVAERCDRLLELLDERHGPELQIGIAAPPGDVHGEGAFATVHALVADATQALRLGPALQPDRRVHVARELRIPLVLAALPPQARARLGADTLTGLREARDWPALRDTLIAWAHSGFAPVRAAAELRIHRNTLLYRLDKIARRTGRDVREPREAIALYLAALADVGGADSGRGAANRG
ncbi:sugar diacid recognition domain-containing protein [Streptomyces sp. NPDC005349]|uniref:CdaR family transcriptional regulator n=1 Tax=Streptomyces sp. NPDC005349 TaxID=3157037 RepID=UPI0033B3A71D